MTHDFECAAHGIFQARVNRGVVPRCPKGCSKALVKLVFLRAPGTVSARTRTSDRLVREMAQAQGLTDISTSPSRPGGSVAQRNRAKSQGAKANPYPAELAARPGPGALPKFLASLGHQENALAGAGFGHQHNPAEWKTDPKTGVTRHVAAPPPNITAPPASVERVREKP